jgi:transcriptional regulator with XRE-family HTH domain
MSIDQTLRLLAKARGLSVTEIASALHASGVARTGAATVSAWLKGEKLPGKDQLDALARTFGVPAGALLSQLASTLDPARTKGEHELLDAYRRLAPRQQGALLEVARSMAGKRPSRKA